MYGAEKNISRHGVNLSPGYAGSTPARRICRGGISRR